MMLTYLYNCFIVWGIGFLPMLGIYVAVPVGFLLELDPVSIAFFAIIGTYLPIPLIILLFDKLNSYPQIRKYLLRFYSKKFKRMLNKHGSLFMVFISPLIGAWTVSITGRLLHINVKKLLLTTLIGMVLYGVVLTALISYGLYVYEIDERILRLLGM